ncbi:MAG: RNB domain-containing ribonuclease, partial [Bacteroidota bacterium]
MEKRILSFLKENKSQAFSSKQIASLTGIWSDLTNNQIRSHLDNLADAGRVEYLDKGKYRYLFKSTTVSGKIEVTRSGAGYLLMEDGPDIYIHPKNIDKAFHGDFVKVKRISKRSKDSKPEGKVIEILQRVRTEFVGVVEEGMGGSFFLLADDPRVKQDFYIAPKHLNGAKDGEKVQAKLINWEGRSPEVEVLEVLGEAGEHNTEMHAILFQYGFDPKFPSTVEAEAEKIKEEIPAKEYKVRRDMREVPTFTIDPHDAKDFDDALSFQILENGNYEVGVHIADVSYYVKPDTPLDREAFKRATSVYLVDRTVPMLPEKLSNKVCSLRPHEEKLTYSAVFEMDTSAKVLKYWVGRTLTYSDHRF